MFDDPREKIRLVFEKSKLELIANVKVAGRLFPCLVDTGAHFTSIPQSVWQDKLKIPRRLVESYCDDSRSKGVLGESCRRGVFPSLPLQLIGESGNIDIGGCVVHFLFDRDAAAAVGRDSTLERIILGMGGGALGKGGLCINWRDGEAYYIEI